MPKKIDYSEQISDIGAPASADGGLLIRAGQLEGAASAARSGADATRYVAESVSATGNAKANAMSSAADTKLGLTLADLGVQAAKGKLEADASSEISGVLKNLDVNVNQDIANKNRELAGGLIDSYQSPDYAGDATINAFREEASRYAEARRQGMIGREEALTQIGAIVKKYSAMMPGWATDFRKVGAELTGISNIDVYGIHQALTTQSTAEKAAAARAAADLSLKKEAASALGLTSLDQLSPMAESLYRQNKGLAMQTQNLENLKKQSQFKQDDLDKLHDQTISGYIAGAVAGVATEFSQLHAANLNSDTPLKSQDAERLGGELSAKLNVVQAQLVAKIQNLTVGPNAMSRDDAEKRIAALKSQFQTWQDAVKTADGFNFWKQQVAASKGNLEHLLNSVMLSTPHLAVLGKTGVLPKLTEAWFALGDKKKFAVSFGQEAADSMEQLMRGGNYPAAFGFVAAGKSSIADEAARSPVVGKVLYNDVVKEVEGRVKTGFTDEKQKATFSNFLAAFTTQMNVANPEELKRFQKLMFSPDMQTTMSQLNQEQRVNVLAPFVSKVERVVPQALADVRAAIEKFNALPENKAGGNTVSVALNPTTRLFEMKVVDGGKESRDYYGRPTSNIPGTTPEQREQMESIKRDLMWVNTVPYVGSWMVPLVNPQATSATVGDSLIEKIKGGLEGKDIGQIFGGIGESLVKPGPQSAAPKNPTQAEWDALRVAELAKQKERDIAAAKARKHEGVTQADADQLRKSLKVRGLTPEVRNILTNELKYTEMALSME